MNRLGCQIGLPATGSYNLVVVEAFIYVASVQFHYFGQKLWFPLLLRYLLALFYIAVEMETL